MVRFEMAEDTISAINTTMAGHDPDPTPTQTVVFTTSENDANEASRTKSTKDLPSQDSLQDELTPAAILEFGLDLENIVDYIDFDDDLDHMDWDSYFSSAVDDNAAEAFQEQNDFNDKNPEEKSLEPAFDTSAAEPESHFSPCFPNTHDFSPMQIIQPTSVQEPSPASQNSTVDPADLSLEDCSDLFENSDSPGHDVTGSLPASFELPDNPSGLDFLQSLQLIGGQIQLALSPDVGYNTQQLPHSTNSAVRGHESRRLAGDGSSSASRVALEGSSELHPRNESRAVLTNPRRYSKRYQGGTTQRQSDRFRTQRNKSYIENSAYTPLKQAPNTWDIFEYTKDGELDPSRLYSPEEINRFFFTHPLHHGHPNLKESQLRLRIHKTPASSAKRFPHGLSCRFKDCPMRTINQGQLLVVADELSVQYPDHDFFLNAAYFHLYCIERFLDFPEICAKLNVSAEGRDARKELKRQNRFCLALDEEKRVIQDYVEACANQSSTSQFTSDRRQIGANPWVAHLPRPTNEWLPSHDQPSLPYKGTLSHQLVLTKLHYGGRGRINLRRTREDRAGYEGANITRHLGDLSKEAELRQYSRSHKNQNQLKPNPKTERWFRAGDETEEDEQHSEPSRPPYQAHGTKRRRNKPEDGQILDPDFSQAQKRRRQHGPELKIRIPEYHSRRAEVGIDGFEDPMDVDGDHEDVCIATTSGISPRKTLTPKFQRTHSQLHITATSPLRDSRSTSMYGLPSTISEDQSDDEIELEILAAQRKRRALEIEDAKDKEKELKLKLQKADKKKRARDEGVEGGDGHGADSKGKRQRV